MTRLAALAELAALSFCCLAQGCAGCGPVVSHGPDPEAAGTDGGSQPEDETLLPDAGSPLPISGEGWAADPRLWRRLAAEVPGKCEAWELTHPTWPEEEKAIQWEACGEGCDRAEVSSRLGDSTRATISVVADAASGQPPVALLAIEHVYHLYLPAKHVFWVRRYINLEDGSTVAALQLRQKMEGDPVLYCSQKRYAETAAIVGYHQGRPMSQVMGTVSLRQRAFRWWLGPTEMSAPWEGTYLADWGSEEQPGVVLGSTSGIYELNASDGDRSTLVAELGSWIIAADQDLAVWAMREGGASRLNFKRRGTCERGTVPFGEVDPVRRVAVSCGAVGWLTGRPIAAGSPYDEPGTQRLGHWRATAGNEGKTPFRSDPIPEAVGSGGVAVGVEHVATVAWGFDNESGHRSRTPTRSWVAWARVPDPTIHELRLTSPSQQVNGIALTPDHLYVVEWTRGVIAAVYRYSLKALQSKRKEDGEEE